MFRNKQPLFLCLKGGSYLWNIFIESGIIGSLFINKVYTLIGNIKKETIVYTTNLISLTSTNYTNDGTFTVGIVDNETDVESNILAYELIKDKDLKVKISKYNFLELLKSLLKIKAGFFSSTASKYSNLSIAPESCVNK